MSNTEEIKQWFENELKDPDENGVPVDDVVKYWHSLGFEKMLENLRQALEEQEIFKKMSPYVFALYNGVNAIKPEDLTDEIIAAEVEATGTYVQPWLESELKDNDENGKPVCEHVKRVHKYEMWRFKHEVRYHLEALMDLANYSIFNDMLALARS